MGRGDRIARVEAVRIVETGDYETSAGLRAPARPSIGENGLPTALGSPSSLGMNRGRHLCVYPSRAEALLVKITTESGVTGWGEAHSPPVPRVSKALVEDLLAPQLVGKDPLAHQALWDRLYHSMRLRGHSRGFMLEALAGVDIALWDLAGKLLNLPVYKLLGGPFQQDESHSLLVPCYASGIPGATLDERVAAAESLIREGFSVMKLSIGRGSVEDDLLQVEALAEAIAGRARLLVDAHGCYDARTAVSAARRMEAAGVQWLEDPLPPEDLAGYAALCSAVDIAIASGETECTRWQFHEKLRRGAANIILPDICRAGGVSEGYKIALVADLFSVPWCAHVSSGSWVHLAAALHLAVATPNFLLCEYPYPLSPNPLGDALLRDPICCENGRLRVPEGPGLGIQLDELALAARIQA